MHMVMLEGKIAFLLSLIIVSYEVSEPAQSKDDTLPKAHCCASGLWCRPDLGPMHTVSWQHKLVYLRVLFAQFDFKPWNYTASVLQGFASGHA